MNRQVNAGLPILLLVFFLYPCVMARIRSDELLEAEELLEEVAAWSEDEIEQLPLLYREKAREYRRLVNSGER